MTPYPNKLSFLKWWDIFVLTLIMFGYFIYNSLIAYPYFTSGQIDLISEFTEEMNWLSLIFQTSLLICAISYLQIRKFDFSKWPIIISLKGIIQGVGIFFLTSILMDIFFVALIYLEILPDIEPNIDEENDITSKLKSVFLSPNINISLLAYSILNGVYEEVFFLGICLSVRSDQRFYYFIYSIFIRYSFHTYQGHLYAVGIAIIIGVVFYYLYSYMRVKNLFPFFVAHCIGDLIGIGIM